MPFGRRVYTPGAVRWQVRRTQTASVGTGRCRARAVAIFGMRNSGWAAAPEV